MIGPQLHAQDPELLECLRAAKDASPKIPAILLMPFGIKADEYAKVLHLLVSGG